MRAQYRFVALLATVALSVGASAALAHGGHGGEGSGDRHGC